MCINPSFIWFERGPKYEQIPVPCKKCWRCNSNRVNDYVGRALCEASVSDSTLSLTLTYAPRDDLAERVITPYHFQDFIRAIRRRGHSVRYIVVGEYGELTARAHFHCILFFKGTSPDIPEQTNTHIPEWPHGHVWAEWSATEKAVRYVCKYLLKNEPGKYWFSLSKKPSIGNGFFMKKAAIMAELGTFPSSFEYLPPGGSKNRPYLMTGASRRDYIAEIVRLIATRHRISESKLSEWVARALQKVERWQLLKSFEDHDPNEVFENMKERLDQGRMSDEQAFTAQLYAHAFHDDSPEPLSKEHLDRHRRFVLELETRSTLQEEFTEWLGSPEARLR